MRKIIVVVCALCVCMILVAGCVGAAVVSSETSAGTPQAEAAALTAQNVSHADLVLYDPMAGEYYDPLNTPKDPMAQPSEPPKESAAPAAQQPEPSYEEPAFTEEAPQTKSFADLAPTTRMSFEELVGDNGVYDAVTRWPDPSTYRVIVDLFHQVVLVYERDAAGAYTVPVRYMVCSSGKRSTPTPRGAFEIGTHRVRFGKFVHDGVFGQYWTQITGKIYFHSLLYSQRSAKTYTRSSYKSLGTAVSHGCVRLLVPDARWLYYHIAPGTQVEIRKGSADDAATAAIKAQLTRAALPESRPNLKAGEIPNTDNWSIDALLASYTAAA